MCGKVLFNKRGMYCNDCLRNRRSQSVNLCRKRKMVEDETNERKVKFFLEAIKITEKSLNIRKNAYVKELKTLGYDYQEQQRRLN